MPVSVAHGSPDIQPGTFPDVYQAGRRAGTPHPRAGQSNPEAGQHGYGWGRIATGAMPRLTVPQVMAHIRSGRADGIGVFCGLASGALEMVEAEGRARDLLPKVQAAADQLGVAHLLQRLGAGCVEESPSGGIHFVLRVTDGPALGNTLLAARPNPASENGRDVLFETRGQGGWFVCAPSAGRTHKSGKSYRIIRGGPSTIPSFTVAERDALYAAFRAVDEMPPPDPVSVQQSAVSRRERPADEILPGDDFNLRASWDEILVGWRRGQVVGERVHWTRPGKTHGTSATTTDTVLCCWTSSTPLPPFNSSTGENGLSKFAAYAHLNHRGDFAAAARDLWARGYGSRSHEDDRDGGQPAVPPEPRPQLPGAPRSLDDWRQEAAARRAAVIRQPGLHLDRSPTGSGKTHATVAALRPVESFLMVLPTHANVREVTQDIRESGIDAVAYPELTQDNCQQFDVARRAQSLGLVAGAAVCPSCPFKTGCTYRAAVKAAEESPYRVCTAERMRRSDTPAEGMQVVVIDEMPEAVLAPTLTVTVRQLAAVDHLAHAIQHYWHSSANDDQKTFASAMQQVVASIHEACRSLTTAGTCRVDLMHGMKVPKRWQRLLMESIHQVGVGADLHPDALALVTRAAAGELDRLEVVTDQTKRGRLVHFVVGSWKPTLPTGAAVVLLDATATAEDVAAAVGGQVNDCTPAGHLAPVRPVVQLPVDISRGTAASTVAGYIESFLAAHPDVRRLGIIGHKPHIDALIDDQQLAAAARERVSMHCYFGQGPDRSSNAWHRDCDHLLVLGTPRANPGAYRRWLVQHGLHDAAGRPDGDWGGRSWESVTVDGQPTVVRGLAYRDEDWHRAYVAVSRSTLHQAVGRGRAVLADGIPVTVLTVEPTPYPVGPIPAVQPAAVRETVDILARMGAGQLPPDLLGCAKSPIGNPYRENCASGPWRSGDCIRAIMQATGVDRRAAEVRLAQCRDAGLLANPRKGWWGLPGFQDTPPPDARQTTCQTAVVTTQLVGQDGAAVAPPVVVTMTVQSPSHFVVVESTGPLVTAVQDIQQLHLAAPPRAPAVIVDAAAVGPVDPQLATTTTSTTAALTADVDDLVLAVDERAAILEFDGGLTRDVADRLALEMVMGRDAARLPPAAAPAAQQVVGFDREGLAARSEPFVDQVLARVSGTVRVIDDREDPFVQARYRESPRPGACRCGRSDWVSVPVHGGRSSRVDCRHCDRFGWFDVWHGIPQPSPHEPLHRPPDDAAAARPLIAPTGPVDQVLVPC